MKKMADDDYLESIAYDAYRDSLNGKSMPKFDELSHETKRAWKKVVEIIKDHEKFRIWMDYMGYFG